MTVGPGKRGPGRLGFIDGLRGIAAFYVVLQHVCTLIDPYHKMQRAGAEPLWLKLTMAPLWYGHFAVAAFIVISGYSLQLSLYNRSDGRILDLKKFFVRRCRRIMPPYYACLALSLVVCWLVTSRQQGLPWSQYLPVTWGNTAAHAFMVQNLSPAWMYKINGVLWSISIEFQLYFIFPFLVWLLWKHGRAAIMLPLIAAALLALWLVAPAMKLYVWYAPLFGLGMAAAQIGFDPRVVVRGNCRAWLTLATIFGVAAIASISFTQLLVIRDSLGGIAVACLLAAGAVRPHARTLRFLGCTFLIWLGGFSYSLYLVHHLVLQVLYVARPAWAHDIPSQFLYLVLCLPLVVGFCWVFSQFFEQPFLRTTNRARTAAIARTDGT